MTNYLYQIQLRFSDELGTKVDKNKGYHILQKVEAKQEKSFFICS